MARRIADSRLLLLRSAQDDMQGMLARDVLDAAKARGIDIDAGEQRLASTEERGRDRDVHFVDEIGFEILPHCRDAAADADVLASRSIFRALERFVDSARHEMKGRIAFHR